MSEIVIHTRDLTKVYRLYASPRYRFLDMFGLLRQPAGAYTEHAALDGVSLDIRRGEKVAFIGRNGAGKSTLLKLLTGVIEPTAGVLDVKGKAHALLQIGSGFHPDFTGRENVYAYLAQLGITGAEADRRFAEIVEFAELEEYIGQPVKTYSSGMAVRLMFSTSTAITPDLLVLDEVLGVGDAYFAHKSYNRIRELCDRQGTTLLLVTHDIYSAVSICERVIWIDHGRVLMDGDGAAVVNAYEDSVRVQEEQRLRLKAEQRSRELAQDLSASQCVIELRAADSSPQPCPAYFSRITLLEDGQPIGSLPVGADPASANAALQLEGTNWSDPVMWQGRAARALLNYGSSFHKVAGTIAIPRAGVPLDRRRLSVAIDYWTDQACAMVVRCFVDGRETDLGPIPSVAGRWATVVAVPPVTADVQPPAVVTAAGRQGSGAIIVDSVRPMNDAQVETYAFKHGEPFELHLTYRINQPNLRERPQILLAFLRDGVQDVMRTICRDMLFDSDEALAGTVVVRFPRLPLANGAYSVTVMVAREGYYDEPQTIYFSINPGVYTCLTRAIDITVEGGGIVGTGTSAVTEGLWHVAPHREGSAAAVGRTPDFPAVIERQFPEEFPVAWPAVRRVIDSIHDADLSALARKSPGLRNFNWHAYLECSAVRMVHALRALRATGVGTGRVLDCGSYFGNTALMLAAAGYRVDAVDAYREYSPSLDGCVSLMREVGVTVIDFADVGTTLAQVGDATYDAVVCLGVIEHVPHSPRALLMGLDRILKPGGTLLLDTPNLAYLYTRRKLLRGESVMPSLDSQFFTEVPFEGHHREYTTEELRWMLAQIGHEDARIETFNYSVYGLPALTADEQADQRLMATDPALREIILSASSKPRGLTPASGPARG